MVDAAAGDELLRITERLAFEVRQIEEYARNDVDEAWARVAGSTGNVSQAFDDVAKLTAQIIDKRAPVAVRLTLDALAKIIGERPAWPPAEFLAPSMAEAEQLTDEHRRHVLRLVEIRTTRMLATGMRPATVQQLLLQEFRAGGVTFGIYRNALKRVAAGAVQGAAQAAQAAAYAPAGD